MKEYIITDDFLDDLTMKFASAQGQLKELIHCKDCKYHREAHYEEEGEEPVIKHVCKLLKGYQFSAEHYCGLAKRKEE